MRARVGSRERVAGISHDRIPVVAAAAATLVVIVVPYAAEGDRGGGEPPEAALTELTPLAQRALGELPDAFETDGRVVVPAAGDPGVAWTGTVGADRVEGAVVDLGVHGLVEYGYLPFTGNAPGWTRRVTGADRVLSDVGTLSFACVRWPGSDTCTGALLSRSGGAYHRVRSGLDLFGEPDRVVTFPVLDLDAPTTLLVGSAPSGAARVVLSLVGGRQVPGRLSAPGVVAGETIWWATVDGWALEARFLDPGGTVLSQVSLDG